MRLLRLLVLFASLAATPADAKFIQTAHARYYNKEGVSEWYQIDITFDTGLELNSATNSLRYNSLKPYAVILWGGNQVSVILLSNSIICGEAFEQSCLPNSGRLNGEDQEERAWDICTSDMCS
jgi:hypothetical protein